MKDKEPRLLYEGFARDIAQTLPLVFTESLSYVQCIYMLYRKVNEIIEVLNKIAEIVERFEDFQTILSRWDRYIEKIYFGQYVTFERTFQNTCWGAVDLLRSTMYRNINNPITFTINSFTPLTETVAIPAPATVLYIYHINTDGTTVRDVINSDTIFPMTITTPTNIVTFLCIAGIANPTRFVENNGQYDWTYYGVIPAHITVEDSSTKLYNWVRNTTPPLEYEITQPSFIYYLWSTTGNMYLSTNNTPSIIFELQYRDDSVIKIYLPHPYQIDLSGSIGNTIIYYRDEELITITVTEDNKIVPVATYKNIIFDVTMNRFEVLHASLRTYTDPTSEGRVHRIGMTKEENLYEVNI